MKIKPGQFEATYYNDQDRTRIGVDPVLRRLEYLLLFLGVIFLAIGAWVVWFICKMQPVALPAFMVGTRNLQQGEKDVSAYVTMDKIQTDCTVKDGIRDSERGLLELAIQTAVESIIFIDDVEVIYVETFDADKEERGGE